MGRSARTSSGLLAHALGLTGALVLGLAGTVARAGEPTLEELCGEISEPGGPSEAERTARAREHYQTADHLYLDLGEYERAIPEYLAAYCISPRPEPIYNVGQAYERVVEYERAVIWFERYLALLPPDHPDRAAITHRIGVLRRLPARLRVATNPPGADVVLVGEDGKPISGKAGAAEPFRVPAGRYRLSVSLPGHEPVTEEVEAEIGQPYMYSYQLAPKTGILRVSASPDEARIYVDRKLVATGSWTSSVTAGEHLVSVEVPGRPAKSETVVVEAGRASAVALEVKPSPRNGRKELLWASTAYGLAAGGILGSAFSTGSDPVAAVAAVAGGVAGFVVPYALAPAHLRVGLTSSIIGGAVIGGVEALALESAITGDSNTHAWVWLLGSSAVAAGAGFAAPKLHITAGDAASVNSGAIWGTTVGLLFWGTFGGQDEERLAGPLVLAGLNGGLVTGWALAYRYEFTRGRIAVIDLCLAAGALSGYAAGYVVEGESQKTYNYTLGGMGVGLAVGGYLLWRESRASVSPSMTPTLTLAPGPDGHALPVLGFAGVF